MPRLSQFTLGRLAHIAAATLTAAILLVGCGSSPDHHAARTARAHTQRAELPGTGRPPVVLGDKNFTEQFLLGRLYELALTAQGYSVQVNPNIGPTDVTIQALQSGRLGMYPEYLSTWNTVVAGDSRGFSSTAQALRAARRYARAHGFELLAPTPFSDTSAIGVSRSYAQQNSLSTIADLRSVAAQLTLGAPPQFQQSPTGLPAVEQTYDLVPGAFKALDVGAQYQALDQGIVQAAAVNTTDAQLTSRSYRLLQDPQAVFGWGNVVPVVSAKVLAAEGPVFATTIDRVTALLSIRAMRQLNAAVDLQHRDPAAVAKAFLIEHGLVPSTSS